MLALISGVLQLIFLILKNKYNQDEDDKKRKEELHVEWADAVKSGDTKRINDMLLKLRS
jgi:hypothetical protein